MGRVKAGYEDVVYIGGGTVNKYLHMLGCVKHFLSLPYLRTTFPFLVTGSVGKGSLFSVHFV